MKNPIAVLIGTRPGIIKMAPLFHELITRDHPVVLIHSGQHYSKNMDEAIMHEVGIDSCEHKFMRPENCISHAEQLAYMVVPIEKAIKSTKARSILVCGDANTNLAGALAGRKLNIEVGHVEAGLRSFDWRMPEEHNRVMIDHISDFLFAPTQKTANHLIDEKVRGTIAVVGNTIVDACLKFVPKENDVKYEKIKMLAGADHYGFLTLHREENVDVKSILSDLINNIEKIAQYSGIPLLFPTHPRTRKQLAEFNLLDKVENSKFIKTVSPLTYTETLAAINKAEFVLTDSGGLQEEACILKTPCYTLRDSTERQETVEIGANIICGTREEEPFELFKKNMNQATSDWNCPYGDGNTARYIIDIILGLSSSKIVQENRTEHNCF